MQSRRDICNIKQYNIHAILRDIKGLIGHEITEKFERDTIVQQAHNDIRKIYIKMHR